MPPTTGRGPAAPWRRALVPGLCLAMTACAAAPVEPPEAPQTLAAARFLPAPVLSATQPAVPPPPAPRTGSRAAALADLRRPGFGPPRIVAPARPLQCVPYARRLSDIRIFGDAWTWWRSASGRYRRTRRPAVGAVLVLKRVRGGLGHLAVVTRVLNDRVIVVSHANWLNQGRIHENTPVKDISFWGNWSLVQVWYTPGHHYGGREYPAYGFILPKVSTAAR